MTPSYAVWAAAVCPEGLPRVEAAIAHARATGGRYDGACRFRHADGKEVWVEANGEFAYGSDGMPVRMMGVLADISARKATEAWRELLGRELGHWVENLLTVVQAVALTSLRTATDLRGFGTRMLEALGRQDLLRAAVLFY